MFIARVRGMVWATKKHPALEGLKLMLVQRFDHKTGALQGSIQMAVEKGIGAGIGDTVLVLDEGSSARQILGDPTVPVRTIIVGIVDTVIDKGLEKNFP